MKLPLLKTGILVIAICLSLAACKKDEPAKKNSFKYNQKEAEINTALGLQFGESSATGIYAIGMEFFEKTLTIHYANNYPDSLSGKGDVLLVSFLTNSLNSIPAGVYDYLPSNAAMKTFSIVGDGESGLLINLDFSSSDDPSTLEVSGGKVTVGRSGDEYEFTFDLKTTVNTNITGYYKGKPVIYSDKKKKSGVNPIWFPQAGLLN